MSYVETTHAGSCVRRSNYNIHACHYQRNLKIFWCCISLLATNWTIYYKKKRSENSMNEIGDTFNIITQFSWPLCLIFRFLCKQTKRKHRKVSATCFNKLNIFYRNFVLSTEGEILYYIYLILVHAAR